MKAIVLPAGAAKGAFQAGALWAHQAAFSPQDTIYYCGSSVGALGSCFLAQFDSPNEAISSLYMLWESLDKHRVHSWTPLFHANLIFGNHLYSSDPLRSTICSALDVERLRASRHGLHFGYTDVLNGEFVEVGKDHPYIVEAVLAASAAPPVFPPVWVGDRLGQDSGVKELAPLKPAIDAGCKDIFIFMVQPTMSTSKVLPNAVKSAKDYILRTIEIAFSTILDKDLYRCHSTNDKVRKGRAHGKSLVNVYVVHPTRELTQDPFDFSSQNIREMLEVGMHESSVTPLHEWVHT